jgi:hypothetical protein
MSGRKKKMPATAGPKPQVPEPAVATEPRRPKVSATVQPAPFGWLVNDWETSAPHVPPNSTARAKHFVRVHRAELVACGALVRHGRELAIHGGNYLTWYYSDRAKKAVAEFEVSMNKKEAQS